MFLKETISQDVDNYALWSLLHVEVDQITLRWESFFFFEMVMGIVFAIVIKTLFTPR